jgi:hypothetical protein
LTEKLSLTKKKKDLDRDKIDLDIDIAALDAEKQSLDAQLALTPKDSSISDDLFKKWKDILTRRASIYARFVKYSNDLKSYNEKIKKNEINLSSEKNKNNKKNFYMRLYYNNSIAFSFRFKITDTNESSLSPSWKLPFLMNGNLSSLSLGGSVGDTKQRESDRNVKILLSFEDLHGLNCYNVPQNAGSIRSLYYPITGSIGVSEVINEYLMILEQSITDQEIDDGKKAIEIKKLKQIYDKTNGYADIISFTTTVNGSLTPSITLAPTVRETFSLSGILKGTRIDLHSVGLGLSPLEIEADKTKEQIQKVLIVPNSALTAQ